MDKLSVINNKIYNLMSKRRCYNLILYDLLYRTRYFAHNIRTRKYINVFSKIDSIKDYKLFVSAARKINKGKEIIGYRFPGCECCQYGHFQALVKYAQLSPKTRPNCINMQHGIDFSEEGLYGRKIHNNAILIGHTANIVSKNTVKIPIFGIGPYIHYASDYYTQKEFSFFKKKLGKTVLIFPTHTYELSLAKRKGKIIADRLINHYKNDYDTIMICVYWHDIDDIFFDYLSKLPKVKLVSAGMRFDPNFISRLRSIIQLSDLIVGTHIGTYLGYALYLNKKVEYFECHDIVIDNDGVSGKYAVIEKENICKIKTALLREDMNALKIYFEEFWGGEKCIKTPKEIKAIIDGAHEINKKSFGFKKRYGKVLRTLLTKWYTSDSMDDLTKYTLFKVFVNEDKI